MSDKTSVSCGVCGVQASASGRMSRVVIQGRTLDLCRAHAATVVAGMPETFDDLRRMFVGTTLDVDKMIQQGTLAERRSPIPRRGEEDRRVFPPRFEGRRGSLGRRLTDPLE